MHNWKDLLITLAIIFTPMLFIIMQRETGSALVYLSFFLMLYREGMTGSVLATTMERREKLAVFDVVAYFDEDNYTLSAPATVMRRDGYIIIVR